MVAMLRRLRTMADAEGIAPDDSPEVAAARTTAEGESMEPAGCRGRESFDGDGSLDKGDDSAVAERPECQNSSPKKNLVVPEALEGICVVKAKFDGSEAQFEIARTAPLQELIDAACARFGLEVPRA